jgi:hypothetical protein
MKAGASNSGFLSWNENSTHHAKKPCESRQKTVSVSLAFSGPAFIVVENSNPP